MIQERVKAGLQRAKAQGKRLGRPTMAPDIESRILALREQGMGKVKIAKTLGVGVSVVQRLTA
jgi:DNA invertase Pin-like site-specific DNA recombinase